MEPYLVQRMKAMNPQYREGDRMSNVFDFDYMGSAEFEWGAIPKAFKECLRLYGSGQDFAPKVMQREHKVKNINSAKPTTTVQMYIVYPDYYPDEAVSEYIDTLVNPRTHLKESCDLQRATSSTNFDIGAWWDIDHQIFICTNETTLELIKQSLNESLKYVKTL